MTSTGVHTTCAAIAVAIPAATPAAVESTCSGAPRASAGRFPRGRQRWRRRLSSQPPPPMRRSTPSPAGLISALSGRHQLLPRHRCRPSACSSRARSRRSSAATAPPPLRCRAHHSRTREPPRPRSACLRMRVAVAPPVRQRKKRLRISVLTRIVDLTFLCHLHMVLTYLFLIFC